MYKRILVVVDARAVSDVAVTEGISLAATHRAELLFFHVMPRYEAAIGIGDMPPVMDVTPEDFLHSAKAAAETMLLAASARADAAGVVSLRAVASGPDEAHCIADAARARSSDLIVAASEDRNAVLRLLTGSVIPGLITASPVPVLVVKERARAAEPDLATGAQPGPTPGDRR